MSREQVIEFFNTTVRLTLLKQKPEEYTITIIPGAHEQAVASHNAKKREEIQNIL